MKLVVIGAMIAVAVVSGIVLGEGARSPMRETVREQLARRGATAEDLADLDSATDALRALASPRDEVRDPILPPFSRSGGLNADWFNALAEALGCRDVPAFTDGTAFLQQDADAILRCARRARSL